MGRPNQRTKLYFGEADKTVVDMALLKDNPSLDNLRNVNKYIGRLDQRLSIPKFTKDLECESPQRSNRNNSISPKGLSQ